MKKYIDKKQSSKDFDGVLKFVEAVKKLLSRSSSTKHPTIYALIDLLKWV